MHANSRVTSRDEIDGGVRSSTEWRESRADIGTQPFWTNPVE